ncbi:MAG: Gfo/Idh/MocA family oxidoreductase [Clostridia bacterium]|nr:Gfo/Idh/MocA family oxidoreductase [Clostridia bacterium]
MAKIRVGIWGCGGVSAAHRRAYHALEEEGVAVELVSLCDINEDNFNREIKINLSGDVDAPLKVIKNCYTDIDEMLAKEKLDLVDICLPTFLHKDAAIKVMESGADVLVEKPMAMTSEECREMLEVQKRTGRRLMIGHLLRFEKSYEILKKAVVKNKYGKLVSADFSRLSPVPLWRIKKGVPNKGRLDSVILDMHIHDIDFVQYLFGMPLTVSSVVSTNNVSYCDSVVTVFRYEDGFVNIRGDWGLPQTFTFRYPWIVNFEEGALYCDEEGIVHLYADDHSEVVLPVESKGEFYEEIKYYIDVILNNKDNTVNPPEESCRTLELIEKIEESAANGGMIITL